MNKSFPILKRFKKIGNDLLNYINPPEEKVSKRPFLRGFYRLGRDLYHDFYQKEIDALKKKVSFLEEKTQRDYIVYKSSWKFEKERCPYCESTDLYQEMVDVGVGFIPVQPKECMNCGALENYRYWHFNQDELREAQKISIKEHFLVLKKIIEEYLSVYTEEEIKLGWSCRNGHPLKNDKPISEVDEEFEDEIPF